MARRVNHCIRAPSEDDYRLATAYHESGHAVVLHALGGSIADFCMLHLEPSQGWRGQITPLGADDLPPATAVTVWFGGPLAECLYWAAFDESQCRSAHIQNALGSICFDERDELAKFIEDVLRERENGGMVKTCVGFLMAGSPLSHMQRTCAFVGDVRRSAEFAARNNIDPQEFLCAARQVLNAPTNRGALMQIASYVAGVSTTVVSVAETLRHAHRRQLVQHLHSQPQLQLRQADILLDSVNSFLPPRGQD